MNALPYRRSTQLPEENRVWSDSVLGDAWFLLIQNVDVFLRWQQEIFEFCDDPRCLLRIALRPAASQITLPGGFQIQAGCLVGELHLWNEHIIPTPVGGPNLAWAKSLRREMFRSLGLLAEAVRGGGRFRDVQVFYARTRLGGKKPPKLFEQLTQSLGFEATEELPCGGLGSRLAAAGECLHLWSMLSAFNPVALNYHDVFHLPSRRLWMSRQALLDRHPISSTSIPVKVMEDTSAVQGPISVGPEYGLM